MDRHGIKKTRTGNPPVCVLIYRSPRDTLRFSQNVNHPPARRSKHEKQWRCLFIIKPFPLLTGRQCPVTICAQRRLHSRPPPRQVSTTYVRSTEYIQEYLQCAPAVHPRGSSCQTQVAAKHLDATRRRKETSGCRQPTSSATQRRLPTTSTLRAALEPPFSLVTCQFFFRSSSLPSMGCDRPKNIRTYMD